MTDTRAFLLAALVVVLIAVLEIATATHPVVLEQVVLALVLVGAGGTLERKRLLNQS